MLWKMKNLYFVKELVRLIPLLAALCGYSQSKGDLAFTAIKRGFKLSEKSKPLNKIYRYGV